MIGDTEIPFKQYSIWQRIQIALFVLGGRTVIFRSSVSVEAKEIVEHAMRDWGIK